MGISHVIVLCVLHVSTSALKLPSYIKACSRNDPRLDECAVRNGQAAIPSFIHGDPKYGVPDLDPLIIEEVVVRQGTKQVGLTLTLKDCKLYGMSNAVFTNSRIDLKKKHIDWYFTNVKGLQLIGQYKANGQVLLLPITGEGKANITITGLNVTYKFDYELVKKGKDRKEYISLTSSKMTVGVGRGYFKLDNLFNGDKLLGDNMNRFLNENWKELVDEVGPEMGDAIGEVFRRLLTSIFGLVPYDTVFPDT